METMTEVMTINLPEERTITCRVAHASIAFTASRINAGAQPMIHRNPSSPTGVISETRNSTIFPDFNLLHRTKQSNKTTGIHREFNHNHRESHLQRLYWKIKASSAKNIP
ncbi:hypothetical protein YC2023_013187 [Brassica napus]